MVKPACNKIPLGISLAKLIKFGGSPKQRGSPQAAPPHLTFSLKQSSLSATPSSPLQPIVEHLSTPSLAGAPTCSAVLWSRPPPEASTAPKVGQGHLAKYPPAWLRSLLAATAVPLTGGRVLWAHLEDTMYRAILACFHLVRTGKGRCLPSHAQPREQFAGSRQGNPRHHHDLGRPHQQPREAARLSCRQRSCWSSLVPYSTRLWLSVSTDKAS